MSFFSLNVVPFERGDLNPMGGGGVQLKPPARGIGDLLDRLQRGASPGNLAGQPPKEGFAAVFSAAAFACI